MGDISTMGFPTKITQVTYSNPVFSFFNIHSYKDDGITDEEYACQPDRGGINMDDPDWFRKSIEFAKTQKDWYSWNNSNWGTKWDVAVRDDDKYPETELLEYKSEGEDNWLVYKYETAWSPAVTILTKLSNLVPNCLLTLEYEEETGWGGEYEIVRGDVIDQKRAHKDVIYALAYSRDGQRWASGGADNNVVVWTSEGVGLLRYSHMNKI